ncbi:MAG: ABC transporter substrate-binding protein [Myxococcaceae bacterium]|nr:ABC transporter substrate-binding protein [Myxococcaceae bacterium]MBH2005990.1 ABC transporter substrate-binding protein [Myxococcaceae bacterium]
MRSIACILAFYILLSCSRLADQDEKPLQIIVATAPESLDPRYANTQVAQQMSKLLYAPLFEMNDELEPVPYLAESVKQLSPTRYRIKLKPGLKFHDHRSLTAEDIVSVFRNLAQTEIKAPIKDILPLSADTVEFVLERPYAPFLVDLCGLGIVSAITGSGSGPYRLLEANSATETWKMESFSDWWQGEPAIQRLDFRVVRDPNARLLELIKGKADLALGNVKPFQLPALASYSNRIEVIKTPGLDYAYLAINLRHPVLADIRVRQAIAEALDIDKILQVKFQSYAKRATGLIPEDHWAKTPGLVVPKYDPKHARQILKESGYDLPIRLRYLVGTDRFRQSIALIYRQQLKEVGIELDLRIQEWGTLFQNIKQGNFDLYSAIWTPVVEPNLYDWVFHSSKIPAEGKSGGNRGAYRDAQVDSWIEEASQTFDKNRRAELYAHIESRLIQTLPYVPLWFEDQIVVLSQRLKNFTPLRTGSFLPLTRAYVKTVVH